MENTIKTIVVIDDDEEFKGALKAHLELMGYEVLCAVDGEQGQNLIQHHNPHLIITDIIMPGTDGIEMLMALRKKVDYGECAFPCPIIVMSGGGRIAGKSYLETAKALGVNAVLEKPFSSRELMSKVEALTAET